MERVRNVKFFFFVIVATDDHGVAGKVLIGVEVGKVGDVGLNKNRQSTVHRLFSVPCRLRGVFGLPPTEFQTYRPKEVLLQGKTTHVD
ncbi:MAG: hypothetical protein BWX45_00549 [Deltaproteobacteria bacterium ADurb.Bin002]|nr:MAG: hypothetical protein BWX45_00549 [Deltaproteobacteria bacterium ADurb.Bin002]